jgi:hypothetical protein
MTTHHRISGIVAAGALALGVSAVPASARPFDISANGSVVPAAAVAAAAHASARSPIPCGDACSGGGYRTATPRVSVTNESGATLPHDARPRPLVLSSASNTAGAPRAVVRVVTHDGGFHWGDAGIGAGGVLALSILGIGGMMAFSHRRVRRGEAALTT